MDGGRSSYDEAGEIMKIGVVGNGFVGHAMTLLRPAIDVIVWDIDPTKCEPVSLSFERFVNESEIIFTAVPTPMSDTGECHVDIVKQTAERIRNINPDKMIVSRSTTPPGTCESIGINFMPEFLAERSWRTDFINCEQWIIGTHDERVYNTVKKMFSIAHAGDRVINSEVIRTTPTEGEMIKYIKNCFLAVKVGYFNEIAAICQAINIDFDTVRSLSCDDSRINHIASMVPGPDGKKGFGGTCLPKDTNALVYYMEQLNVPNYIIKSAVNRNETIDRPGKDWKENKGRAVL